MIRVQSVDPEFIEWERIQLGLTRSGEPSKGPGPFLRV